MCLPSIAWHWSPTDHWFCLCIALYISLEHRYYGESWPFKVGLSMVETCLPCLSRTKRPLSVSSLSLSSLSLSLSIYLVLFLCLPLSTLPSVWLYWQVVLMQNASTANMTWLTSQQALADTAYFINEYNKTLQNPGYGGKGRQRHFLINCSMLHAMYCVISKCNQRISKIRLLPDKTTLHYYHVLIQLGLWMIVFFVKTK